MEIQPGENALRLIRNLEVKTAKVSAKDTFNAMIRQMVTAKSTTYITATITMMFPLLEKKIEKEHGII